MTVLEYVNLDALPDERDGEIRLTYLGRTEGPSRVESRRYASD